MSYLHTVFQLVVPIFLSTNEFLVLIQILSTLQDSIQNHSVFSCHVALFFSLDGSLAFFGVLLTSAFKTIQTSYFIDCLSIWLTDVSSWLDSGMHFRQENYSCNTVFFSVLWFRRRLLLVCPNIDVNCCQLIKVVPVRFLHCEVTIFPFIINKWFVREKLWDFIYPASYQLFVYQF